MSLRANAETPLSLIDPQKVQANRQVPPIVPRLAGGLAHRLPNNVSFAATFGIELAVILLPWISSDQRIEKEPLMRRIESDSLAGSKLVQSPVQERDVPAMPFWIVPPLLRADCLHAFLIDDILEWSLRVFEVM